MSLIQVRVIREKSKQWKIPYENLLLAAAREWILEQASSLSDDYDVRLERASILKKDHYRVAKSSDLYLQLVSPVRQDVETFMEALGIDNYEKINVTESYWELKVLVPMDKMEVPVHLVITRMVPRQNKRVKLTLSLLYKNDETLELYGYCPEEELCLLFNRFVSYQGLYADMEAIDAMWETLTHRNLEGRFASLTLDADVKEARHTLESLEDSAMKKRWKGYLRAGKRKEPDLSEVAEVLGRFFGPILEAKERDEIFLGDWIPDLKRYL